MARDGCIPFSKYFYQLSGDDHTPFRTIVFSTVCSIIVIMPVSEFKQKHADHFMQLFSNLMYFLPHSPLEAWSFGRLLCPLLSLPLTWLMDCHFSVDWCGRETLCQKGRSALVGQVFRSMPSLLFGSHSLQLYCASQASHLWTPCPWITPVWWLAQ